MTQLGEFQILLIDDNPADAKLFETALTEAGTRAKLYWVATAEEGIEYLRGEGRFAGAGPVGFVVCDLSLPGKSGLEFLVHVKKDPVLGPTPVVMYSSSRSPHDIRRCYELGANSYIVKPMSLQTIISTIGAMVRYWLDIVALPDPRALD